MLAKHSAFIAVLAVILATVALVVTLFDKYPPKRIVEYPAVVATPVASSTPAASSTATPAAVLRVGIQKATDSAK